MSASFKKRWCVLSDDSFHVFKKVEDSKPTTVIQLKNYTLTTHLGPTDIKILRGRKHCIKLVGNQTSEVTPKIIRKSSDKEMSPFYLFSFTSQKEGLNFPILFPNLFGLLLTSELLGQHD